MTIGRRRETLKHPDGHIMRAQVGRFSTRWGDEFVIAGGLVHDAPDHIGRRIVIGLNGTLAWLTPNTARRLVLEIEACIHDAELEARQ